MLDTIECKSFTLTSPGVLNALQTDVLVVSDNRNNSIPYSPKMWKGLWDTGASGTCIDQRVVADLNLIPIGKKLISTAAGLKETNTYLVDIGLPNRVMIKDVLVSCADLCNELDVLIGMDIISLGDFAITNITGKTTFSFRIPSVSLIDFCDASKPYSQIIETIS